MNFDAATDIDLELLKVRARKEAELIYSKESTRQGRTLLEIFVTTMYGHAAEVYLMQHQKFKDDIRAFHDVIDTNNNYVEVKVTEGIYFVKYVLKRATEKRLKRYMEFPDILYIFINNKKDTMYNLYGIYDWNGTEFIKRKTND